MCSKPIFCSKIALKGKTCSRLLKPQKVAPNAKSCSKVVEHNRDRPSWWAGGGGGRPGIGGGFDSSHRPVVGTFDHFNGLSSNILLTFSCYFDNQQMPCSGAFEQKLSAQFKCPAYARPPPPPLQLNIDRCINRTYDTKMYKSNFQKLVSG